MLAYLKDKTIKNYEKDLCIIKRPIGKRMIDQKRKGAERNRMVHLIPGAFQQVMRSRGKGEVGNDCNRN